MTTIFLHGFWGQPGDWSDVLARLPLGAHVWIPDLYEAGPCSPRHSLEQWIAHFHDEIHRRFAGEAVQLVGYSMGGRLALNAAQADPGRFSRLLLLSTAPVLIGSVEDREKWELEWTSRFQSDSWEDLERVWDEQTVFRSSARMARRRSPALRELLGLSLGNWSVTRHGFGENAIQSLPSTVEWMFGALDQKYLEVAKFLRNLPVRGQISLIENAGHRLLADTPESIATWVEKGIINGRIHGTPINRGTDLVCS
jgi:2-succinyl-6-hydroxy-2,4-cyclohexadiene-1-carboxylate synthase